MIDFKALTQQLLRLTSKTVPQREFAGSEAYWSGRYRKGRGSGSGSCGEFAHYKAEFLNRFIADNGIETALEFGSGDGVQLGMINYPQYTGIDVSPHAIEKCKKNYRCDPSKRFLELREHIDEKAELTLSLDVIYHLIEERVYIDHLSKLFDASTRFAIVYSTNHNDNDPGQAAHIKHRRFTDWVSSERPAWRCSSIESNPMCEGEEDRDISKQFAHFYVFERRENALL